MKVGFKVPWEFRTFAGVALAAFLLLPGVTGGHAAADGMPLKVEPPGVDVGDIAPGSHRDLEFVLTNNGDRDIRLKYIFAQCDCRLAVADQGVVPAQGKFILRAVLEVEDPHAGCFDEMITVLTDHCLQRELRIPVTGCIMTNGRTGREEVEGG